MTLNELLTLFGLWLNSATNACPSKLHSVPPWPRRPDAESDTEVAPQTTNGEGGGDYSLDFGGSAAASLS